MRVPSGRLIMAAACCVAIAAVPASVAEATSPGAALTVGTGNSSTVPAKLTTEPARPGPARSHDTRERGPRRSRRSGAARHGASGLNGRVTAHVARDPGVTIADFHFSPATTTIHVGDTITWSNSGPSSHTATARNGSFNTGILKKGQSASHTFTQPGTYAYVCQIHPFMHGTITVLAGTTSTTPSAATTTPTSTTPSAATTTPTSTTPSAAATPTSTVPATTTPTATTAAAAAAPSTPTLPNTGFNVVSGLLAGLLLVALGAGLRRSRAR